MNVEIRPLKEKDAYVSVKWRNDPEIFRYTGNTYNHEIKIETELDWIKRVIVNPNEYRCAIEVDGVYIGNIYLTDIADAAAHYHIFIGEKSYWGKGIAQKASELILKYGFEHLHLQKVLLRVKEANIAAHKLYIKLGFKEVLHENDWITMELLNLNSSEK